MCMSAPKPSNTPYKIGIVGYGVVGQGIHKLFGNWVEAIYDPYISAENEKKAYDLSPLLACDIDSFNDKHAFKDLDLVVVSVPTPSLPSGEADSSFVIDTVAWLLRYTKNTTILIKSTTPPSVLFMLSLQSDRIVFSPEYMGESAYFTQFWKYPDPRDMEKHDFQIFGGDKDETSYCVDIFMRKMGPHVRFHQTDIVTASLVKYMENCFFATKVTFCNEFYSMAVSMGADYNELRQLWLLDSRVEPMHTAVFPKKRGYGGKCYPKDLRAIIFDIKHHPLAGRGLRPGIELLTAVHKINESIKTNQ